MLLCWDEDPDARPSFRDIVDILTEMTSQDKVNFISLREWTSHHCVFMLGRKKIRATTKNKQTNKTKNNNNNNKRNPGAHDATSIIEVGLSIILTLVLRTTLLWFFFSEQRFLPNKLRQTLQRNCFYIYYASFDVYEVKFGGVVWVWGSSKIMVEGWWNPMNFILSIS